LAVKTFIILQKISNSNKCCPFELSIHQKSWGKSSKILGKKSYYGLQIDINSCTSVVYIDSTLIIMENVS